MPIGKRGPIRGLEDWWRAIELYPIPNGDEDFGFLIEYTGKRKVKTEPYEGDRYKSFQAVKLALDAKIEELRRSEAFDVEPQRKLRISPIPDGLANLVRIELPERRKYKS